MCVASSRTDTDTNYWYGYCFSHFSIDLYHILFGEALKKTLNFGFNLKLGWGGNTNLVIIGLKNAIVEKMFIP